MSFEEKYVKYSEFVDYFQDKTGGSTKLQFANWVDLWCWNNGYRISFSGGVIPERFWSKEKFKDVVVRNNEVNMAGMPVDESDLLTSRFNIL